MERKTLSLFVLLLVVFASQEMMMPSEARTCQSQSKTYKGVCVVGNTCGLVCRNEGFHGGECVGFRRRCFCTKPCLAN